MDSSRTLKFTILDVDGEYISCTIGETVVKLGSIMAAPNQIWQEDLTWKGKKNRGQLLVRAKVIGESD